MNKEIYEKGIHVLHISPARWWHRAKWKLLNEYVSANEEVTVRPGFITDGISIPWFLRWRFSPTGKYFGAAIVHDYLLIETGDWDIANNQFEKEMEALHASFFDKLVMVNSVKLWGWFATKVLRRGPKIIA